MSKPNDISTSQELTVAGLFTILRRRRSFLAITTSCFLLLAVLLCVFMTRRYQATAVIQVGRQSSDELGLDGMKGNDYNVADALEDNIALQTQANILQSDTLALKVIRELGLENTPDFRPRFNPVSWALGLLTPAGPKDPVGVSIDDAPARRTRALRVFEKHLKVKPASGTRLIQIVFTSSDPKTAALVVNHLAQGLVDYTFETRYIATSEASTWLSSRLEELKKQAEDLQAKVVKLQREAGVYSLGSEDASGKQGSYNASLDRLQQSTEALSQATSNRILKGAIYEMVKQGDPEMISGLAGASLTGNSQSINNSFTLLQTLRGQQAALQTQIAADTSKYGSANPKLEEDRASMAGVTAAVNQEVKRIGTRAENDYRAAQITENKMRADYLNQKAVADQVNDKAVEYTIAKQEADQSRNLYDTLYQHLKAAGVVEGLHSSNVSVVDPGRVPAKPSSPNIPLYLGASLFGGLFFGSIGAFFLDSIDDRVRSITTIEQTLHTPLLGVIPNAVSAGNRKGTYLAARPKPKQLLDGGSLLSAADSCREAMFSAEPNTAFAEALRSLRTALLLSRSSAPPKVILVTSAAEGEGKSTISVYLAAALARNHSRVLLVEADMRCSTLSHRLSLSNERGLSNLLSGDQSNFEIRPFSDLPDLALLPSGPNPPYPAELLGSRRMKELLDQWSDQYDFIIVDSPSLLAVTDAVVLSKFADFTLLVTRHAQSTRKSLERAWQTLHVDPETRVGVVLNGVSRDSADFGEYFGYSGKSYYTNSRKGVSSAAVLVLVAMLLGAPALHAGDQNTLLIAPGDVLHMQVADTPEMEAHARVTDEGTIPVVGIGEVKVAGLTPGDAALAVHDQLIAKHYLNHPEVSISVEEFATQHVSIIGEVKSSGAYPIATPRPVLDVLALAGGLTPQADRHILIERQGDKQHPIEYYVSNDGNQAIQNQPFVNPGDTIVVSRAGIVYILGDVNRPGGYVMSNNESQLTLLQGLALAGGVSRAARQGHAHLIRKEANGGYQDTQFSVADVEKGKRPDLALVPGDVLYLPFSFVRNFATSGMNGVAASTTGAAIYAIP